MELRVEPQAALFKNVLEVLSIFVKGLATKKWAILPGHTVILN